MALEAGIRDQRIDSVLEVSGAIPSAGVFIPFGDVVKKFSWNPDAAIEARRGIGSTDALGHDAGPESHTATVSYLLQGAIAAGTPLYEAFTRNTDGIVAERTIVQREKHFTGGAASAGVRTYVVLEGAKPSSAKIPGDPGSAGPIQVDISYTAEKGRSYEISQPAATTVLAVESTVAGDNGGTVTVEDDGGTQEAIIIGGTSSVSFASIDAVELTAECTGDITILVGTSAGATLVTIYGSAAYDSAEGDMGVPLTPATGSRTATLGTTYEKFLGDDIAYGAGDLAYDINSVELSVDNSIETKPRHNTRKQRVTAGNRVLQLSATVLGETEYQDEVTRHLQVSASNITWTLTNSTLVLTSAVLTDVGEKTEEEGAAFMSFDNTFEGRSITIT